ncbi:MAG: hypothetical protein H6892_00990 [Brucellaceae bacterium]|nr:hypothetical protein [Brucellaceae bacterium]
MVDTCFMIQPFDGGRFDKLFEDVFDPAVRATGLEPYRVDRDPSASIPIDDIERGIRDASVCFVDLSVDNPNVWFELGFAIAEKKDLCLVCAKGRDRYPFDIQHRSVISYSSESPRDFKDLSDKITERIKALLKKQENVERVSLPEVTAPRSGLKSHEIACIATIASEVSGLEASISNYYIKSEMEKVGYNSLATQVSLRLLLSVEYISMRTEADQDGDPYEVYALTSSGWDWVAENIDRLNLKATTRNNRRGYSDFGTNPDDEIPF